jgi:hypothetical protein
MSRRTLDLSENTNQLIFEDASGKVFIGNTISVDYLADQFLPDELPFSS